MKYTDNRRTVSDGGEYDESRSDISLYYEEYGDGSPLILLHGNGEDHTYFSSQTPFFAKNFRVITPEGYRKISHTRLFGRRKHCDDLRFATPGNDRQAYPERREPFTRRNTAHDADSDRDRISDRTPLRGKKRRREEKC